MVNYKCSNCEKNYVDKLKYTKHINRKFPCKKINHIESESTKINSDFTQTESDFTEIELDSTQIDEMNIKNTNKTNYQCCYCKKIFTTNSNWNRHIKDNCKVKKHQDNEKENTYNKLMEELELIKKQNEKQNEEINELKNKLNKKKSKCIIKNVENQNIIENQNNIQNQNNIILIAYGREDLSKIDSKFILEALQRGTASIPVLTERIHFNVKYPEFQNVYIPNMSHQYCMVYNGTEWLLKDKNSVVDYIYSQSYDHLDNNFEDFYEKLPANKQKSFKEFIKIHEKAEDNNDPEALKIILGIKQELKLMLYNKRNIILNKQKK